MYLSSLLDRQYTNTHLYLYTFCEERTLTPSVLNLVVGGWKALTKKLRAAVSYTVPKGGIVLGVAPEEEKKGREIQRARGPKVRVEKRPTRTVIQLKLEDIREKCGAAALARFGT
jgi:hypothetical protein